MPRISFRIRPAVGFFHHEKARRMKKKEERKGDREREREKIERIVTASRANRAAKS